MENSESTCYCLCNSFYEHLWFLMTQSGVISYRMSVRMPQIQTISDVVKR